MQWQAHSSERFRMAEEQVTTGPQMLAETPQHGALCWLVEIDQHVATEDNVEVVIDRIVRVHQVQPLEPHPGAQLLHEADQTTRSVTAAQQVALAELERHHRDHRLWVDGMLRGTEHLR